MENGSWKLEVAGMAWVCLLAIALGGLNGCQVASPAQVAASPTQPPPTATLPASTPTPRAETLPSIPTPGGICEVNRFGPPDEPTEEPQKQAPTSPPAPTSAPEVTIARGPYLQSVTADSIIVVWKTDVSSPGEVMYGETTAYGSRVADPQVGTCHAVTLTGLAPYTVYHYQVESGGDPLSKDTTFRTAAGPDQAQFTFAAFGDTRTQHQYHRAVVEQILMHEPDFVLHSGDLVERGTHEHEWKIFFEIERELMARAPLFPALGNHEMDSPLYFDHFYLPGNERWYAFDYGNARFVCLQVDGSASFAPPSEQYTWLEQTLAANTQPWLIVVFHIPPYSSVQDDLESDVRQALTPLFEQYGVAVVFNGHKHNYERNEVGSVTYVVSAGGGAPLYAMQEREPTQAAFALAHHFVLVQIDGGHLRATAISSTGQVLDQFERCSE